MIENSKNTGTSGNQPIKKGLCNGSEPPDNNFTCDPNSGLQWLNLTVTFGRSFTDISAQFVLSSCQIVDR